jgi:hypothetical protein
MASEILSWTRQGEAFWRAHHEAWKRSDLNQRQYCEAEGTPLEAFGNWRAKFAGKRRLLHGAHPKQTFGLSLATSARSRNAQASFG